MSVPYFTSVFSMIKCLHYRAGIGDIAESRVFGDGRIELIAKGYGMKPRRRRGRLVTLERGRVRVHLYGKQVTGVIVGPVDA